MRQVPVEHDAPHIATHTRPRERAGHLDRSATEQKDEGSTCRRSADGRLPRRVAPLCMFDLVHKLVEPTDREARALRFDAANESLHVPDALGIDAGRRKGDDL